MRMGQNAQEAVSTNICFLMKYSSNVLNAIIFCARLPIFITNRRREDLAIKNEINFER